MAGPAGVGRAPGFAGVGLRRRRARYDRAQRRRASANSRGVSPLTGSHPSRDRRWSGIVHGRAGRYNPVDGPLPLACTPPPPRSVDSARYLVILNPAAGRGAAARAGSAIGSVLKAAGVRHHVVPTQARGHATEIALRAAGEGWTAVVAAGGDGTVHEVANGLLREAGDGPTVPMGIVPVGSGNDFAKLVGAPTDAAAATRRLLQATPRRVDAGRVGDRFFTNGVGIGLDARVGIEAAKVRRLRGIAIYLWALARVLPRFRPPRMRVELDGVLVADGPLTLVTAANGGCHGGGFWICPAARIDDGELDVAVADALGTLGILDLLPRVMRGTHVGRPRVRMLRARRIRVTSPDPLPVHADGEILSEAAHELEIKVLPGRLTVLG
ncbi:MAG TPA: diacylglycerol kinase family protein [Longimicrobiaceae bacterium]|nr:diacylglycerol kinase family protein [Longimicrobiaceae bacterium]